MTNWLLERKLKHLGQKADPSPAFLRSLEKQLKQKSGHGTWWIQGWKVAVGGLTAVSLMSGATGVYAYNSEDVTPDHPLYSVRTALETVETSMATNPEQKARVGIKHLERRVKEQQVMQSKHKPVTKDVIKNIETSLDSQIDENDALATSTRQEMDEKLGTLKEQHVHLLKQDVVSSTEMDAEIEHLNTKIEHLDGQRKSSIQKGEETSKNKHRDEGNRRDEKQQEKND